MAADSIYAFNVTGPANTPIAVPIEIPLITPPQTLVGVQIVIPDGHAGLTGIALGYGHVPIHPDNAGGFISGNDETVPFETAGEPDGVPWSAFVYNLDLIDHSWQVRLLMDFAVVVTPPTPAVAIAPADIIAAGS